MFFSLSLTKVLSENDYYSDTNSKYLGTPCFLVLVTSS